MANIENILSSDNLPQGTLKINNNFEELNVKKIELVGLTSEMLDTDYFTIKKDDGKFYLITKADADLGGGGGTCGYTEVGNIVDLDFLNGTITNYKDLDTDGNFYIAKNINNIDTGGNGIFILKIDSNFNIIQHSLIRYSPTVGNKGLSLVDLHLYNGELVLFTSVYSNSLNPVIGGTNLATACFIRIDKSNLNILGNTVIVRDAGINRSLTIRNVVKGQTDLGISLTNGNLELFGKYSGTGSLNIFSVSNSTGVRYIYNGINDFIGFFNDASVGIYKYIFLNTLAGLNYTSNIQFAKIINDGTNYYACYNGNKIYKLNSNLEPLLSTNLNYSTTENIMDMIYHNNFIYVLSQPSSSYGNGFIYLHIFNSSDLTFYKKLKIQTLLSTPIFRAGTSSSNYLFIKDGYIYIFVNTYNVESNLRIFKIGLDPANGDYLTQPAKKTNMYNIIVDQTYTSEAGSTLVKGSNITTTKTDIVYMNGNLGSPGLTNTSGSISQVKLWIGI